MNTRTPNELIHETSPYLQQHAYNPVQWLPWGDKALSRARNENKPIFLSIGYSACHWCHVMERECFMDPAIAAVLNEFFIPIKVDREERPDVDHIYMTALQAMSEHSGWPLNMFLTPNAEPFYGGTFFPKDDDQGVPGFENVLKILAKTWNSDQHNVILQSKQLTQHLKVELNRTLPIEPVPKDFLRISVEKLQSYYDADNGGFHGAPKFPHAFYWDLYVEYLKHEKNKTLQDSLQFTLHKMAEGGLYDQLAGGFHRYSTDALWYLPHFEKMLYDNAVLARTYFEASQVVDKDFNIKIGKEICDYILQEMTHKDGAFYSSTDADTDDIEGKHFVWSLKELKNILGEKDGILFAKIFHIEKEDYEVLSSTRGTPPHDWFDGHILCLTKPLEDECKVYKTSVEHIQSLKLKVLKYRQTQRTLPFRDEKILTSWNALMIQALVVGFEITGEKKYFSAAKKALHFLESHLMQDGHVLSTWKDGKAQHKGTLEDYAHLLASFIALHRATKEEVYLTKAKTLCEKTLSLFWEDEESWFYYTSDTDLLIRAKNLYDQALPSSHSVMAENLLYMSKTLHDQNYQDILDRMLVHISGFINKVPHTVSSLIKVASRNL